MAQIRVLSVEALGAMAKACGKFSFGVSGCMDGIDAACTKVLEEIRERNAEAQREAEAAAAEVDRLRYEGPPSDDDDDSSSSDAYYDELNEAESQQANAEYQADLISLAIHKVECAYNEFLKQADALRALLDHDFQLGINSLRVKVGALSDWSSGAAAASGQSSVPSRAPATAAPASRRGPPTYQELAAVPLPQGFRWVQLDDINLDEELRDVRGPEDFSKASYEEVARGFAVLLSDIIPRMQREAVDAETFAQADHERGVDYEHGAQRAFEAFFSSSDPISLSRGARPSRGLSVDSGRHRIRVALDAGWPAVIVRINDSTRDLL